MNVLLTTLHAKYSHSSLALPCLASYCRDIPEASFIIREWTVNEPREHLLKLIMSEKADMVAFSCYIWNIEQTLLIASDLKKIAPHTIIVLGGPEVSFEIFTFMHENPAIDFIIKGEGEIPFRGLLSTLLHSEPAFREDQLARVENLFSRVDDELISGPLARTTLELDTLPSPFSGSLVNLAKPLTYYETSRGCPFSCAFCLSSVEGMVRSFSLERIKQDLLLLMHNNVPQIKLVDRTFNFNAARANEIWQFILEHNRNSHFHFEIAADLLTDDNMKLLSQVPERCFRFEIGIQSTSASTLATVGRTADLSRIFAMVKRLKAETAVELHLDLVAGLPGEDYQLFLDSLQAVADLQPDMLQVEPLKLLKGAPMRKIAAREGYAYSEAPPYTILNNPWLSYGDICRIETIGRLMDLFGKHGRLTMAFRMAGRHRRYADILDLMARQAANDNLSGLSCRRVHELFARFSQTVVPHTELPELYDALFFDFCSVEMPLMGKLPSFIADRQPHCSWGGRAEFPEGETIPPNSRIKSFRYTFMRDYRLSPWQGAPAQLIFTYIATPGTPLQVRIIPGVTITDRADICS